MKKLLYTIAIFSSLMVTAQDVQWEKTLGGKHADYLNDAIPTLDYGFILVGGSLSNKTGDVKSNAGDFDYLVSKITETGLLSWTKTLGGTGTDIIKSITNTPDGGYLLAGMSNSPQSKTKTATPIGMQDVWLVKLNIKGQVTWQKTLGGLANDQVQQVIHTHDGGFLLAISSASSDASYLTDTTSIYKNSTTRGNLDYWLVRLDATGTLLWQKSFGGRYRDELKQVVELADGNIVIGGSSNSPAEFDKHVIHHGKNDWWILKLDKDGNTLWQESFGNEGNDELASMLVSKDQQILLAGSFADDITTDFKILKIASEDATIIWEQSYDVADKDISISLMQNIDKTLVLSGYAASTNSKKPQRNTEDFFILKTDEKGNELWREFYGDNSKEVLRKSIVTRDGGYVLLGTRMPFIAKKHNDANFWLVKLLDKDKPQYQKPPLEAVPNPTASYTQIVLGKDYNQGTLQVIALSGKVVQTMALDGKRIIPVDLSPFARGVYLIQVSTDQENNSVKVIKK